MDDLVQDRPAISRLSDAKSCFRSILVHVEAADAQPRLAAAAALARALDATLIGVGAEMMQPPLTSNPMGTVITPWVEEASAEVQRSLDRAEKAFRAATQYLQTDWLRMESFPTEAMIACSRGADLIIAGGPEPSVRNAFRWCDPAELAIKSGRPVLVVPESGGPLRMDRVLVAWKDTRESRRAVADALPFLKAADDVLVVEVSEHHDSGEAQMHTFCVVENLKRHGVKARAKAALGVPVQTADVLISEAEAMNADLIVSGAYGHSRLGEWVFGGATAELLKWNGRYRLISH